MVARWPEVYHLIFPNGVVLGLYQRPSKSSFWLDNTNYTIQITLKIALRAVVSPGRTLRYEGREPLLAG